ncbi:MAG: Eco57I restriction-modification methylase domain-containing protein, partial [Candidatus Scalindua sp.]
SFDELLRVHKFSNFVELHNAWQKTLDIKELNKRFYKELSNWYFWAMRNVYFPGASDSADKKGLFKKDEKVREHNAKNLIRLLTRILFIWFTKEKNLIPDELFDESFIKDNLLKSFEPRRKSVSGPQSHESKYYRAILQNLFFATLNQTVGKREFRKSGQHMNVTNLMRYESYFKNKKTFLDLVEKTVPFMNGGLFECLDKPSPDLKGKKGGDVIIYEDGFSDRPDNELCVPDYIFFGTSEHADLSEDLGNKSKDVEVKGLLNIFKSYKFTITENTPIEEDIALDPELLGKVFENLLASYNPETKTTARKQTGSFYTPREIVNYMVDESLIAYLKQKMEDAGIRDKETDLRDMISYSENQNPFSAKETAVLIEAIDTCKILDPTCGSGAFPMGILHKLVHILDKLDPKNKLWKERQIQKASVIDDAAIRDQLIEDIETAFNNNELDYGRKLYLIENCIYGVDAQPIASQISKLRCFISLIVDQRVDNTKDNFGVRPLPNLETKFVAANTLIGIEKPKGQLYLINPEINKLEEQIKDVRHRLFNAKTPATKRKLREDDKILREKMGDLLVDSGWENKTARQLASWDPYDQNASSPFFDPEWMFGIVDGFDVVIGNPPYVQIQKFSGKKEQKDWENEEYITYAKTGDIYCLFYEKGNMLLRDGGVLTYITSNKWMRANYGKATRNYFAQNTNPLKLIDFAGFKVFESATVDTNIFIFTKAENRNNTQACSIDKDFKVNTDISEYFEKNAIVLDKLGEESWIISSKDEYTIKRRIEEIGTPLKDWNISIYRGILTGFNEAFIISGSKKDELIAADPKNAEIIKPVLRGRDIKRYRVEFADLWLINTHNGYTEGANLCVRPIDINDFPAIKKHLDNYWSKLEIRQDKGVTPYNLRNCAYLQEFEKEKIVYPDIASKLSFSLDKHGIFMNNTCYFLNFRENNNYALSILNSNLMDWYFRGVSAQLSDKALRHFNIYIELLPIPHVSNKAQKPFEILVDCILYAKETGLEREASTLESVIDGLVYDLYFEKEMKKANCYITDRIREVVKPFKEDDTDDFKMEYIKTLYDFCNNDKTVYRGLIHRRNVNVVKIINGELK